MADSFADLWSTTAPLPPKPKPQTLSAASSSSTSSGNTSYAQKSYGTNQGVGGAPKKDVFSMLAGTSTSTPSPRYGSASGSTTNTGNAFANLSSTQTHRPSPPLAASSAPGSRSMTPSLPSLSYTSSSAASSFRPAVHQTYSQPVGKRNSGSGTGDAFGDLFASASGSMTGSGSGNASNMTLAARLAMESQQQRTRSSSSGGANTPSLGNTDSAGGAWAGLDALGGGGLLATPTSTATPVGNVKVDDVDDWGLGDFGSATTSTTTTASTSTANTRKPPPTNGSAPKTTNPKSLWDLDEFTSPSSDADIGRSQSDSPSTPNPHPKHSHTHTHKPKIASVDEPFDFGGREDRVDEQRQQRGGGGKRRGLLDLSDDDDDVEDGFGGDSSGDHNREEQEHDDILGVLSGPPRPTAQSAHPTTARVASSSAQTSSTSNTTSRRPPSPPPHILGQIVEMGFSIAQARKALANTATGVDVEQALESLLSSGGGNASGIEERNGGGGGARVDRDARAVDEIIPPRPRGAPKGQKERERERLERQRAAASSTPTNSNVTPNIAEIQDQASELLAQASEIGLSVFSKASAMWGKGRERVVKAYEERGGVVGVVGHLGTGGGGGSRDERVRDGERGGRSDGGGQGRGRGAQRTDGKPRWMQDVVGSDEEGGKMSPGGGGFRDDHEHGAFADEHDGHGGEQQQHRVEKTKTNRGQDRRTKAVDRGVEEGPTSLFDADEEEVDLFAPAPAAASRSAASTSTSTSIQPPPQRRQQRQQPSRAPPSQSTSAPPIPDRPLPTASPTSLSQSQTHKSTGTASFKLGQYALSITSYTSALECLPNGHLLRVPLYTNRAVARMRVGEYVEAEEDCQRALGIVRGLDEEGFGSGAGTEEETILSLSWTPTSLPPSLRTSNPTGAWIHPQGHGVDLADGYIKALKRRAECLEAREKWKGAMRDWEVLSGCGTWVGERVRAEAGRGRARCRGMLEGNASASGSTSGAPVPMPTRPKPATKPKPKPSIPASTAPSKALAALQSTTAALEADDALRHSLKDAVDARLLSWKSGKETNIRALLCSLDSVLWDGVLEGVRVKGLGDVVSAAQVKKAYVRVVGRVHPDKLNASNSNVEQRMLANGVFGTLNEAWIAFQAGQK